MQTLPCNYMWLNSQVRKRVSSRPLSPLKTLSAKLWRVLDFLRPLPPFCVAPPTFNDFLKNCTAQPGARKVRFPITPRLPGLFNAFSLKEQRMLDFLSLLPDFLDDSPIFNRRFTFYYVIASVRTYEQWRFCTWCLVNLADCHRNKKLDSQDFCDFLRWQPTIGRRAWVVAGILWCPTKVW